MKLSTALIAATAFLAPLAAFAQGQNCGNRELVVERLTTKYGESRQSIGMAPQGRVVEVFASLETGTWTITVTNTSGLTCLVASGQAYEATDDDLTPAKGTAL